MREYLYSFTSIDYWTCYSTREMLSQFASFFSSIALLYAAFVTMSVQDTFLCGNYNLHLSRCL